jgi:hypothetical protein
LSFSPYSIGGGDQNGLLVLGCIKLEEPAEKAYIGQNGGIERFFYEFFYPLNGFISLFNTDSGILVRNLFQLFPQFS